MNLPKGRISSLGQQFMPVTQLKGLESSDYPGHSVGEVTSAGASSRVSTGQHHDMDRLRQDIGEHGLKDPLYVRDNTLLNGHHRAQVAQEQGHMFVPHTPNPPKEWAPQTYRKLSSQTPNRTWEPLIREHENEAVDKAVSHSPLALTPQVEGQQQLFQTQFTDKRTRHG